MLLILDVDGVLTDGKKFYDKTGKGVMKTFCDKDFTAIKMFKAAGWDVVFLSGDENVNKAIAEQRNIPFYLSRVKGQMIDKSDFVPQLSKEYDVSPENMVYVGDDIFDISIMKKVGWSFCPADSRNLVKDAALTTLVSKGGDGCVGEIFDWAVWAGKATIPSVKQVVELDKHEKF